MHSVQRCVHDAACTFRTAFLTQMPSNDLRADELERLESDVSGLREFFGKFLSPDKVDAAAEGLEAVVKLAQCESVDEFEEAFGFMLMEDECKVRLVFCLPCDGMLWTAGLCTGVLLGTNACRT